MDLKRRQKKVFSVFIVLSLISAGILFIAVADNRTKVYGSGEDRPLFTFVHLTDTHCLKTDKGAEDPPAKAFFHVGGYKIHWKDSVNSFPILKNTVEYLNKKIKPDFLIHTGDLSEGGKFSNLKKAKELLDKLDCPYYAVMGDHDAGGYSYSELDRFNCNYVKVFGKRCRSFNWKDWHIIILGVYTDREELDWLKEELAENLERPVILATHRLIVADRFTRWLGKKYSGCSMVMPKAEEVLDTLKSYKNVKMVLSGHCHSNFRWNKHGIAFISTAALLEVPCQFKLFRVYPDRIEISLFSARRAKDVFEKNWVSRSAGVIKLKTRK